MVPRASGQSLCFEAGATSLPGGISPGDAHLVDVDGDGKLDIVVVNFSGLSFNWLQNLGNGTFAPAHPTPCLGSVACVDIDADNDGHPDLAVLGGQSFTIFTNALNGNFVAGATYPTGVSGGPGAGSVCVSKADFDHDGYLDLVVANYNAGDIAVFRNLGNGTFAPAVHFTTGGRSTWLAVGDMDGDADVDIVVATTPFSGTGAGHFMVFFNNGSGVFTAGANYPTAPFPGSLRMGDIDGDGDIDVLITDSVNTLRVYRNLGLGQFGGFTDITIPGGAIDLALLDADADGDLDVAVAGNATTVLENQGNGNFIASTPLQGTGGSTGIVAGDLDGDGHSDLVDGRTSPDSIEVRRNCATTGIPYCFGDGSGTACPCNNASAIGARAGCLHSFGGAGKLVSSGVPSVAADSVTLEGSGMTNGQALYFQAVSVVNAGAGAVFGDGLRCTSGTTVRLGTKVNAAGISHYPDAGDPTVSVKGAVAPGATRYYQVLYRNIASFCTSATFNLSNGLRLTWSP